MKILKLSKVAAPAALAGLFLAGSTFPSQAQLTSAQKKQLNEFVGNRAEVGVVLGASDSASGGSYTVDGRHGNDDLDFSLMKFGGTGLVGEPRKLGDSGMTWHPVVMGTLGYLSGDNSITAGALQGNKVEESALGIQFGGGIAAHITPRFTITPTIGVLYGHYEIDIDDRTPAGTVAKEAIDDSADSIGANPGIGMAYALPWGRNTWEFSVRYAYYGTSDISDSELDIGGDSHILEYRVDLDIPLPYALWNCPLHTGGYVSLTQPFGDLGDTMDSDVWATVHGRILLNTTGKPWAWRMDRLGLGMSGIFADSFTGWDIGVDVTFLF